MHSSIPLVPLTHTPHPEGHAVLNLIAKAVAVVAWIVCPQQYCFVVLTLHAAYLSMVIIKCGTVEIKLGDFKTRQQLQLYHYSKSQSFSDFEGFIFLPDNCKRVLRDYITIVIDITSSLLAYICCYCLCNVVLYYCSYVLLLTGSLQRGGYQKVYRKCYYGKELYISF